MSTDQAASGGAAPHPTPPSPLGPNVPTPNNPNFLGAGLSYLVPGLGQIVQGRVAKGVLFLVCVYTLFFYGVYLGAAEVEAYGRTFRVSSNVYIPAQWSEPGPRGAPSNLYNAALSYPRPQVLGQFFVGVAFWPAIIQYNHAKSQPPSEELDKKVSVLYMEAEKLEEDALNLESSREKAAEDGKTADDLRAEAKQKLKEAENGEEELRSLYHPILKDFMREPSSQATNVIFNAGDKRLEIAWVYTVIAGVLNVLVIFDALMGPAYTSPEEAKRKAA